MRNLAAIAGLVLSLVPSPTAHVASGSHPLAARTLDPSRTGHAAAEQTRADESNVARLDLRVSRRSGQTSDLEPAYQFLWTHWTERRWARLTVRFYGVDAGVDFLVTISPTDCGVWYVDVSRRNYTARQRSEQAWELVYSAPTLRRVDGNNNSYALELVRATGESLPLFPLENWPPR